MAVVNIGGYNIILDEEDVSRVTAYKWYPDSRAKQRGQFYLRRCYVVSPGRQSTISLHRFLLGCVLGDGVVVDHINHNTLDNRKQNLRRCSASQNGMNQQKGARNKSGYKGVLWDKVHNYWLASIRLNRRTYFLGYYTTAVEAAHAYDKTAKVIFREFALLNFPQEIYSDEECMVFLKTRKSLRKLLETDGRIAS